MRSAFDLAAFTICDGAEAAMLAERPAMINALRRVFPGLLFAWLTTSCSPPRSAASPLTGAPATPLDCTLQVQREE
jgi:hypothetical protein